MGISFISISIALCLLLIFGICVYIAVKDRNKKLYQIPKAFCPKCGVLYRVDHKCILTGICRHCASKLYIISDEGRKRIALNNFLDSNLKSDDELREAFVDKYAYGSEFVPEFVQAIETKSNENTLSEGEMYLGVKPSDVVCDDTMSYMFHYIISIVIPLAGIIMGSVMLASDNKEKVDIGKRCILWGIVSNIALIFFLCNIIGNSTY